MDINDVRDDIAAFADDEGDIDIDKDGHVVFMRGGKEYSCQLEPNESSGFDVRMDDMVVPYKRFLSHTLARLDVFAQRLSEKRPRVRAFVNGRAHLDRATGRPEEGNAVELLGKECAFSPFTTRVLFVTADAGHGKTVLLREYQARCAERFLKGRSPFVFWHVDLQGRQLVRLSEALMADLGELRIMGIYMPSVVRLLRHGVLILGVDGFDELAAEQGSTEAFGALSALIQELNDRGVVVAASRRTFFDTEDYLERNKMLRSRVARQCEFDQLHLEDWSRSESVEYLTLARPSARRTWDATAIYDEMLAELGGETTHPMLSRPFLVAQIAKVLAQYALQPAEVVRGVRSPIEGVAAAVRAFVEREVSEKWKVRETGEPYLTVAQHFHLLEAVADEMWRSRQDRLELSLIETLVTILMEDWRLAQDVRRRVVEMLRMHVLLTIPFDGDAGYRAFDHPEFRSYFIAMSLLGHLNTALDDGRDVKSPSDSFGRFLSCGQLPDSVARYAMLNFDRGGGRVGRAIETLRALAVAEVRPSVLHMNIGTIVPFLLDRFEHEGVQLCDFPAVYSSLVFEGTRLTSTTFEKGTFVRCRLAQVQWKSVRLEECDIADLEIEDSQFEDVAFVNCRIRGVAATKDDEETREYSPEGIGALLAGVGIAVSMSGPPGHERETAPPAARSRGRQVVQRILRVFSRTTGLTENIVDLKFHKDRRLILDDLLPLMERHGIVQKGQWRGSGSPQGRWVLTMRREDLLRADAGTGGAGLVEFWQEVDRLG